MFLHQQPPSTTSLMAQISGDLPYNSISGFSFYESPQIDHSINANNAPLYVPGSCPMYSQIGGGTFLEFPKSRKREREELIDSSAWINTKINRVLVDGLSENYGCCSSCSSLDGDMAIRMQKEQLEMDRFVAFQMEKLMVEMEQKTRNYWSNVFRIVEQGVQRILKSKNDEIAKMSRKNTTLEDKVKMLLMEGQIWKTFAQANEATVMKLRRDLELVQEREGEGTSGDAEDTMSCCIGNIDGNRTSCQGCRKNEISILVLPCRHLCLCEDCDPRFESCPLCMSTKSASIKVHLS